MYRSPIHISGLAATLSAGAMPDRSALLLARRKLEAEFELSGQDVITVEGATLNRQELISLFDELQNSEKLAHHLAIFQDPALLQFLETGMMPPAARWAKNPLYESPSFLHLISPHYAAAVDALYKSVLTQKQPFEALEQLAANPSLMLSVDTETAFRVVSRYFLDKKNALLHLLYEAKTNKSITKEEVLQAAPTAELRVLNALPDGYEDLRYDVATALNNLCVAFDKRGLAKQSLAAIEQAAQLQLKDGELVTLIPANLKLVRAKQPGLWPFRRSSRTNSPGWRTIIFIIVIIVRLVMSFGSHGGSDINTVPDFSAVSYSAGDGNAGYSKQMGALLDGLADTASGVPGGHYPNKLQLAKPKWGVAPFSVLLAATIDMKGGMVPITRSVLPDDSAVIRLSNRSAWDVTVFYSENGEKPDAVFLPQNSDRMLFYAGSIRIDFTAGRAWSDDAMALLTDPERDGNFVSYRIKGWYTQRPANLKDFIQHQNPLIVASDDSSASFHSLSLTFDNSSENAREIRVNIDSLEGDLKRWKPATRAPSR